MGASPALQHNIANSMTPGWDEPAKAYTPTEREHEVLKLVSTAFDPEERDTWKYPFERQWFTAVAFYEGIQHVYWNEISRQLEKHPAPSWRRHFISNYVSPTVQRGVSMIMGAMPKVTVAPASEDRSDRDAADLSRNIWNAYWLEEELDEKAYDAMFIAAITGNAFIKVTFDPNAGLLIGTGSRGQPLHEGRVRWDILNPWQVFIDPSVKSIDESSWMIQETVKPLDVIRREYPERGQFVQADKDASTRNWMHRRLLNLTSAGGQTAATQTREYERSATVREFWMRPTDRYKKGLHVIYAGDVILNPWSMTNPGVGMDDRKIMEIPIFQASWAPALNRFWKIGLVEPLVPIQRELNATRSQIVENKNMCSRPKWLVPKGSGVPDGALTSEPGERVPYNPNFPAPAPMPISPLPQYVFNLDQWLKEDWQAIAAQSDVTQGNVPSDLRSGHGIQLLQEKDESVYAPIRRRFWQVTLTRAAQATLLLMQKNYKEERTAKLLGVNSRWRIFQFSGADLTGNTDIRYVLDTGLGQSRSARMASVREVVETAGLDMTDPSIQRRVLMLMESNALEEFVADLTVDEHEAEAELAAMTHPEIGEPTLVMAKPWQNHAVHARVKGNFRKGAEYRELVAKYPEIEYALTLNLEGDEQLGVIGHEGYMQREQEAQMQMQAAMQSTPAPKGQPSPPKRPPTQDQMIAAKQIGGMNS